MFVLGKLEEFWAHVPAVIAPKIDQLIILLNSWGETNLPQPIWLPRDDPIHGSLWLGTHDINEHGPFLQDFLKCNVWVKETSESRYYGHCGTNLNNQFRFTYSNWINELFNDDHKNMFYSARHFYQGPEYSSLWLREQFRLAFDDLVSNVCKKAFDA